MTIDEFMTYIAPKMRSGWVAMDENFRWSWFCDNPKLDKSHKIWYGSESWGFLDCYDIAPVDDWTQSLRKVNYEESKSDREIELEKKLEIAVNALEHYADAKTWDCCYRNQCAYIDGYIAQQALKEIK